jgi:hypothetical protein
MAVREGLVQPEIRPLTFHHDVAGAGAGDRSEAQDQ